MFVAVVLCLCVVIVFVVVVFVVVVFVFCVCCVVCCCCVCCDCVCFSLQATTYSRTSLDSAKSCSTTKRRSRIVSKPQESRVVCIPSLHPLSSLSHPFTQDEELFGQPARLKQMTGNRSWGESGKVDWTFGSSSVSTAARPGERELQEMHTVKLLNNGHIGALCIVL